MSINHTLLVGTTGAGKSTLLRKMAIGAMQTGHGLLLLDPHGDLADELVALVPKHRKNDLVVIDPRVATCPGLNPLRHVSGSERTLVVSGILATLRKTFPLNWGPRTDHLLRYCFLALCEVRGATLTDARDMLVDEVHRRWVLKQVRDPEVIKFWTSEFTSYDKRLQAEAIAAPLNKLGALLSNAITKAILERRKPLDPARCLLRQRIVLARLSKGALGEDGCRLLGGLLLGGFQRAIMAREALPPDARTPFHLMVDEVTSFATGPFLELLAEARKYRVPLSLATQSVAMMDAEVRAAILGNIGQLVSFRVGAEDALFLRDEFAGRFGPLTLTQLSVGERIVKVGGNQAVILGAEA